MSMDNNNNEFEQAFHRFRQHSQLSSVSEDFENEVFAKIKKKKTQRKVVTSVTLGILIFAFLFIGRAVLFHKDTEPTMMARPGSADKEEVPVMEDVIYASSDSRTNYAIEQVAYYEKDDIL
jgi:hypothetical protein